MEEKLLHVSYWDKKFLAFNHPNKPQVPYFQLSIGEWLKNEPNCIMPVTTFSKSLNLYELSLEIFSITSSSLPEEKYHITFCEDSIIQLGEKGKNYLKSLVELNNSLLPD
jgi:hypothetical protein